MPAGVIKIVQPVSSSISCLAIGWSSVVSPAAMSQNVETARHKRQAAVHCYRQSIWCFVYWSCWKVKLGVTTPDFSSCSELYTVLEYNYSLCWVKKNDTPNSPCALQLATWDEANCDTSAINSMNAPIASRALPGPLYQWSHTTADKLS